MSTATSGTEMILRDRDQGQELMPVMSIEQAIQRYNMVVQFAKTVMREGIDYGTIPGTERKASEDGTPSKDNHTLLKPGAEKLCTLFGLVPDFQDYRVIEDWDKGLFYYAFRCILSRRGVPIASGIGSCNSREKKYLRASRLCPECSAPTIKRSKYAPKGKPNEKPGWYCYERAGGCGRQFDADDPKIVGQRLENDPSQAADMINTIQKMAQKRSLVAATLIATNASEFFTQDVEDMEIEPRGDARGEVLEGEEVDQRPPHEKFREQFIADLKARQFTDSQAHGLLTGVLQKARTTLEKMDPPLMQRLLENVSKGIYDQLRTKAKEAQAAPAPAQSQPNTAPADPAPAPETAPTSEILKRVTPEIRKALEKKWEDVKRLFLDKAKDSGIGRTDFEGGLWKLMKHMGVIGKEDQMSMHDRASIYFAIIEKRFDYSTGEITDAPLVNA